MKERELIVDDGLIGWMSEQDRGLIQGTPNGQFDADQCRAAAALGRQYQRASSKHYHLGSAADSQSATSPHRTGLHPAGRLEFLVQKLTKNLREFTNMLL
ncbi:hypothetical protein Y032_0083g1624 [Ancylostoma ceylanicum]|uniref:Uncharacterized protein n=1 Tax=Ancylostoma ceylanicum TaxID=53326 RepID=A0A016TR98_9BILA|nr:hypothetical protein Y032_0083g1624 [Ancylostoma ceylanicum]